MGANLTGVDLRGATLEDTDFSGAVLSQVDLTKADLQRANLSGATLIQTKLIEAVLTGVDLSGVILTESNLTGASMAGAKLSGAHLSGATLSDVTLTDANLTGALLNTSNLTGASLKNANLSGASFIGADLASVDLSGSKLIGATLIGTNLKGANLRSANLIGSRLLRTDISGSDKLIDTVLFELNKLQFEQITIDVNLRGVNFNQETIWPEGVNAFLIGVLGDDATLVYGDAKDEEATTEPDFLLIGQSSTAKLNQTIISLAAESALTVTVAFDSVDPAVAFGELCTDETVAFLVTDHPIHEVEAEACAARDQFPVEILIASEAHVLVIHPQNNFIIEPLSVEQAQKLLTADHWSDVNSSWPHEPLTRYFPDRDATELELFSQWIDPNGGTRLTEATQTNFISDHAEIVRRLDEDEFGVAIVDYSTYLQNSGSTHLVEIEGLVLSPETVANGNYLFVEPLYLYLDRNDISDNRQVADFLDFYLNKISEVALTAGFYPIDLELLAKIQAAINQAQVGELLLGNAIIETAAIAPDRAITETVTTTPLTTIVAVGERMTARPLITAYSQIFASQEGLSLSFEPLAVNEAVQHLCIEQTADIVMVSNAAQVTALNICMADSLIAIPVATDGIAIIIHPDNNFANALTFSEVAALLLAETWSEVNANWPEQSLTKVVADEDLYRHFVSILAKDDPNLALSLRPVTVDVHNRIDQLVQIVANDPNSVGIVSLAAMRTLTTTVQFVEIEGQAISAATIRDGNYPLTRPLFLYTTSQAVQAKPFVGMFLMEYLARIDQFISLSGYISPPADLAEQALTRLSTIDTLTSPAEPTTTDEVPFELETDSEAPLENETTDDNE